MLGFLSLAKLNCFAPFLFLKGEVALKTHLIPKESESSTYAFGLVKRILKWHQGLVEHPGAGPSGSRTLELYNLQPLGRPGQHYVLLTYIFSQ